MLTVKPYKIHSVLKLLTLCSEKLEAANNPLWHVAARGAVALDSILIKNHYTDANISGELSAAADSMNSGIDIVIGLSFRIAAAYLDAFRLGFFTVDQQPAPRWFGLDMAMPGADRTVKVALSKVCAADRDRRTA